jgi:hypothetical protein
MKGLHRGLRRIPWGFIGGALVALWILSYFVALAFNALHRDLSGF